MKRIDSIKSFCLVLGCLSLFLFSISCGGDTLNITKGGDQISLAALSEDNQTSIFVPVEYFGNDITEAKFNVFVNGTQIGKDLDPSSDAYLDETTGFVDFSISSINDGDIVTIRIVDADGVSDTFAATVSADQATFAVSVEE